MKAAWLAVASAEHVEHGRDCGFMQVCHGRATPLRRIGPGDGIVYYSPSISFRGKDALRAFTAIGTVRAGTPYQVEMYGGFRPFRRDVAWAEAKQALI
ncbi:EVE domain-containing protein, partial [Rhizobiaceae sp. 2RAB30]